MSIAVVKYNAGNIRSVLNAMSRLGVQAILTDDADELRKADKVIFPGQGEASTTMAHLRQTGLDKVICSLRQPVLAAPLQPLRGGQRRLLGRFRRSRASLPHSRT